MTTVKEFNKIKADIKARADLARKKGTLAESDGPLFYGETNLHWNIPILGTARVDFVQEEFKRGYVLFFQDKQGKKHHVEISEEAHTFMQELYSFLKEELDLDVEKKEFKDNDFELTGSLSPVKDFFGFTE